MLGWMQGLEDTLGTVPSLLVWGDDWSLGVLAEVWLILSWWTDCSLLERDISHLDTFGFRVGWIAIPWF